MLTVPLITAYTCIVTVETSSNRVLYEYCTVTLRGMGEGEGCKLENAG